MKESGGPTGVSRRPWFSRVSNGYESAKLARSWGRCEGSAHLRGYATRASNFLSSFLESDAANAQGVKVGEWLYRGWATHPDRPSAAFCGATKEECARVKRTATKEPRRAPMPWLSQRGRGERSILDMEL